MRLGEYIKLYVNRSRSVPFTIGIAYRARNTQNGKAYIGITKHDLEARKYTHQQAARLGSRNSALHCAIRKYGPDAFTFEHIASAKSEADLLELEKLLIQQEGTMAPAGYNLVAGGRGILTPVEETRIKMRAWKRSGEPSRTRWADPDYKERTAQKMSLAHKGKPRPYMRGRERSPEHAEAIRKGLDARWERTRFLKACRAVERECRASIRTAATLQPRARKLDAPVGSAAWKELFRESMRNSYST